MTSPGTPPAESPELEIDWKHVAPSPVALVLLQHQKHGTVILHRNVDGRLYGLRSVAAGPACDAIVGAWVDSAVAAGHAIEDRREPVQGQLVH